MLRHIFLAASLASLSFSAPTKTTASLVDTRSVYAYSSQLADFYAAVSEQISKVKSSSAYASGTVTCDMEEANANFPSAPTPMPSPSAGSTLQHVMLGMGYQVCCLWLCHTRLRSY